MWLQRTMKIQDKRCGFHKITEDVIRALPEIEKMQVGILQVFIQHTSASLTISENSDPDVAADLNMAMDRIAPEEFPYRHTCEGSDDMPAHVKNALLGSNLSIPIREGKLALGTWQGIFLCEHRRQSSARSLVLTLWGETI